MLKFLKGLRRPPRMSPEDYLKKLQERGFDKDGKFVPDSTPMAPPIGYKKVPSMVDLVRDMVRSDRLAQEAAAAGYETFEEAEDFDIDDDPPLRRSAHENDGDPSLSELVAAGREAAAARPRKSPASAKPSASDPPSDGPEADELSGVPDGQPAASARREATE